MAGQIAHNFDEKDGWMIPAPLWGEIKFRIHTSRKGIIKKKIPDAEFTSCHKTGKDSGCRGILLLTARVCQKTPPSPSAGPDCLLSDDSCQGQTTQTFAIIAYQFVFKLSGCREESAPCRKEAAGGFRAAAPRCAATTHPPAR